MSYQPVATAELTVDDETFANDRDLTNAKEHHKGPEHAARHLLLQQQKQPLMRLSSGDTNNKTGTNQTAKSGSNPVAPAGVGDTAADQHHNPAKPNVSFKLSDDQVS